MSPRCIIILAAGILFALPALAEDDPQSKVGWFEVYLPSTSVARPAIEAARAEMEKLDIVLVSTSELKRTLKQHDHEKGIQDEAGKLLARGRELHLGMKLEEAAENYRRAAATLEEGFALYYDPGLLAEPILQLGVSLFESGKRDQARKAFMRAASLVPSLQMSEGYYSPSVREAFARVVTEMGSRQPAIPSPSEMERMCKAARVEGMVVISVERLGDRPLLRMGLFDPRVASYTMMETAVLSEGTAAETGRELATRLLDQVAAVAGVSFVLPPAGPDGGIGMPDGGRAAEEEETDPWYIRHWWIWPVAAAVVGTAIALPLTVFRRDVVDVHVY